MKLFQIFVAFFTFILISCGEDAINSDPNTHVQYKNMLMAHPWYLVSISNSDSTIYDYKEFKMLTFTEDVIITDEYYGNSESFPWSFNEENNTFTSDGLTAHIVKLNEKEMHFEASMDKDKPNQVLLWKFSDQPKSAE